ncbi:MAG: hypothetical protein U5K75_00250 [Ahrensia sp.]|nr:hypothetical protein [Ahrensia sp.]
MTQPSNTPWQKSRDGYAFGARTIERAHPNFYASPVAAIDRPLCRNLFERIWHKHGLASANNAMRTLSAAISWAQVNWRVKMTGQPRHTLANAGTGPARALWHPCRNHRNGAGADAIGLPAIGDSILMGLWTGQRQADRLEFIEPRATGQPPHIQAKQNRRHCCYFKSAGT